MPDRNAGSASEQINVGAPHAVRADGPNPPAPGPPGPKSDGTLGTTLPRSASGWRFDDTASSDSGTKVLDDATGGSQGGKPPIVKTELTQLPNGDTVLGNPWDSDGAFPRPIVDPPVKPLGSSGGFLGDEQ